MVKEKSEYKQYTLQAQRGIKGEAFFELLISQNAIANHVVRPKDIGIDFFCQWVYEDRPTQILFAVQVKTFGIETCKPKSRKKNDTGFNNLEMFDIKNFKSVDDRTLKYWQTLGMPVYLFAVCDTGKELDCYYKRFAPMVTEGRDQKELPFYKVNDGSSFLAFSDKRKRIGGFTRDLFVDYIRCCYAQGRLAYLNPRTIGLGQFPDQEYVVFKGLFEIYEKQVVKTYEQTKGFVERYRREKGRE